MRKVIMNLAVSLDGFIEGPNGEYDWCFTDQDYGMKAFFDDTDSIFMGRKSYDMVVETGQIAHLLMQRIYIFSDTAASGAFGNTALVKSLDLENSVNRIKAEDGGNIWLFGGAGLINSLMNIGAVDEIHLSVHPVILGGGKPLFAGIKERTDLNLVETIPYANGLVQLRYEVLPQLNTEDINQPADQ